MIVRIANTRARQAVVSTTCLRNAKCKWAWMAGYNAYPFSALDHSPSRISAGHHRCHLPMLLYADPQLRGNHKTSLPHCHYALSS
eukprot:46401-Eustigmatos_ZCMA.PRE.1